jgi:chromosome segregation ATPase
MGGWTWAVGLTMIEATLFVGCAGWLLWRIERRSEDAACDAQRAFEDIRSLVREMRGAEEMLRAQAERAHQVLHGLVAAGRSIGDAAAPAAGLPADAELHAESRRLAAHKGRLEGELDTLKPRLFELETQLNELRHDRRAVHAAASTAEALRSTNEHLMAELKEARRANRDFRARLDPLTTEVKVVQAQITALADSPVTADADRRGAALQTATEQVSELRRAQAAELQRELERHKERLDRLQDELSRTLREKSFIEDRFLDMAHA